MAIAANSHYSLMYGMGRLREYCALLERLPLQPRCRVKTIPETSIFPPALGFTCTRGGRHCGMGVSLILVLSDVDVP